MFYAIEKVFPKLGFRLYKWIWRIKCFYMRPANPLWIWFGKCACGGRAKECWSWRESK